jgi:hypothetical protein
MKWIVGLVVVCVVALAILIGTRISTDAMALVVGIVCGIGASIPTSLLMIFLLTRHHDERDDHTALTVPPTPTYHIDTVQIMQLPERGERALTVTPRRVTR